jgi:uncharacterized protein (DUF2237 family)
MVVGPTKASIDDAIQAVIGDSLVAIVRPRGNDLSTPPPLTFWQGGTPGPSEYDLGGGTWISERAHLFVQVAKSPSADDQKFLFTMNVKLQRLLDRVLPAESTFAWATSQGFQLDISRLDFDGLTP